MKTTPQAPAHPCHSMEDGSLSVGSNTGLTKREYFANSAPDLIPEWFKHNIRPMPEHPGYLDNVFGKGSSHPMKHIYMRFYNDETNEWITNVAITQELKDAVSKHIATVDEWWIVYNIWGVDNDNQRYFQWRLHYADALINSLNSEMSSHGLISKD